MLLTTLSTLLDANGSHDQKNPVASNFYHLYLKNVKVLLMVVSTSCDADTNAMARHDTNPNGIGDTNTDVSGIT